MLKPSPTPFGRTRPSRSLIVASEIWSLNEKIGVAKEGPRMPEVGDVLELDHGGEVAPWEVEKIHHYFPLDGRPVQRIVVKYIGVNATAMML
jgi:hypothetical protein